MKADEIIRMYIVDARKKKYGLNQRTNLYDMNFKNEKTMFSTNKIRFRLVYVHENARVLIL